MKRPTTNPLEKLDVPAPPEDLLARCEATVPGPAPRAVYGRRLALGGMAVAALGAALLPTWHARPPVGMTATFAQTEDAMRQVSAWHIKEQFTHLDLLREKPRSLRSSRYNPQLMETWYRADAGELSYFTHMPDEPGSKSLLKPNGDFWMRFVNHRKLYRDPNVQKRMQAMHEKFIQKLREEDRKKGKSDFPPPQPPPPREYVRTVINAQGMFEQWDVVSRSKQGENSWDARREYVQTKITHPEKWGIHAATQVLIQNLNDAQTAQLQVRNRLLQSGKSVWKGHPADRFDFQVVPFEPKQALPASMPDIFLIAYVDPETHRVIATQEEFRDRGHTKRLMFRQQEFDYTEADPKRFAVEEFTRGAVLLPDTTK